MSIYPFNNVLFFNHDELFVWTCRGHDSNMQWLINQSTMLQKFSKCEVKAWLCWNLIILPPLRFCVKSHFGDFKQSKNVIYGNFRGSELWFSVNLSNFQVPKLPKFNVQCLWNCHKWLFWTVWIRQNVISRKIGVAVKSSNFN